jgi:5-formyltetrahydrofolate cyclo-ligase
VDRKDRVRSDVWRLMERPGIRRFPGATGRIPNFVGAEAAAGLLFDQREWSAAEVVKVNPDSPQLPVRARALEEGKLLVMAVPRLREARPFLLIHPSGLRVSPRRAASIRGAASAGKAVLPRDVPPIDLVVCGTVAVNHSGIRVGKGGGFSDLEFALLRESGRIHDHTAIATTVHDVQVLDAELPETAHDFRVDVIATPRQVIRCPGARRHRPPGILWDHLSEEKIAEVPLLTALHRSGR